DAFIVFRSFPSQENAPENSNQYWSSSKGSDQVQITSCDVPSDRASDGSRCGDRAASEREGGK
ncbi:hypothetical protein, partial [Rhizobium johnstonii]|uniref:hypothetical protein n=1 Tax=Rhizobium johnstonii TaxID=3019933 RepID=UPI003F9B4820